jgi:hypothetical protein
MACRPMSGELPLEVSGEVLGVIVSAVAAAMLPEGRRVVETDEDRTPNGHAKAPMASFSSAGVRGTESATGRRLRILSANWPSALRMAGSHPAASVRARFPADFGCSD